MSAAPELSDAASRTQAPFGRRAVPVIANATLGAYRVIRVRDEAGPGAPPRPGQFYMLATATRWGGGRDERPLLPRAFSVLRSRPAPAGDALEHEFLLEDVGPGTARLAELLFGEELWLTGPLGRGFRAPASADRAGPALLVGGGVGIAPLAIWQDELLAAGADALALLGFRDAAHAAGAALLADPQVATDDGSVGQRGLVTDLLEDALGAGTATVYACGPPAMLEAVRQVCVARGLPAQLALEAPMACGFGACFGCVVATADGGYKRVCLDGPVFAASELAAVPGEGHGG
jgi:NAD(P)H-flavin reductase